MVRRGHTVVVHTTDASDSHTRIGLNSARIEGVDVKYFRNISNSIAFRHKLFLSPGMFTDALKTVRDSDIVHLHDTRTVQNLIYGMAAKCANIPYVVQPHGTLTSPSERSTHLKSVSDHIYVRNLIANAAGILALNSTEAKKCEMLGAKRSSITVVPNGIDVSIRSQAPPKGSFRREYSIPEGCKFVLYLGRLHGSKGIELLLTAFSTVSSELDSVRLFLVGPDDGYGSTISRMVKRLGIEDKVVMTGSVSESLKYGAYSDADVFVTPEFYGFPLTFLEAMLFGAPIVTTDKGDRLEWIDGNVGFVADNSADGLSSAILKILMNESLAKAIRVREAGTIVGYDWSMICDSVDHIYAEIVGAGT